MSSPAKEYLLNCFEIAIEDLCNEHNLEWDQAEDMLVKILDQNPHYLDGYYTYD